MAFRPRQSGRRHIINFSPPVTAAYRTFNLQQKKIYSMASTTEPQRSEQQQSHQAEKKIPTLSKPNIIFVTFSLPPRNHRGKPLLTCFPDPRSARLRKRHNLPAPQHQTLLLPPLRRRPPPHLLQTATSNPLPSSHPSRVHTPIPLEQRTRSPRNDNRDPRRQNC